MNEPSLDAIHEILFCASKALVLKTAIELDVFTEIARGNGDAEDLAQATHCNVNGIRTLLDALIPLGFMEKRNDEYLLTRTSSSFLVRDKPSYYGASYLDALLPWAWCESSQSADALRSGLGAGKEITDAAAVALWQPWCEAHVILSKSIIEVAEHMWSAIGSLVSLPEAPNILDLACGHSLSTLALAQRDPLARITAVDRYEEVLAIASRLADNLGLTHRFQTIRSDIANVTFESEAYDVVYIGGVLYLFDEREIEAILTRVGKGMRSEGLLVVNTMIVDDERSRAIGPLIQSFRRFLYNGGRVPTFDEYKRLFETSGFQNTARIGESVLIARRGSN